MNPSSRIRHMVVFSLKHPDGSVEEQDFLAAAQQLASIAGVEKLEVLKQVSAKNDYDWGIFMEFADRETYERYNDHPDHVAFIKQQWMKSVDNFLELDFEL